MDVVMWLKERLTQLVRVEMFSGVRRSPREVSEALTLGPQTAVRLVYRDGRVETRVMSQWEASLLLESIPHTMPNVARARLIPLETREHFLERLARKY